MRRCANTCAPQIQRPSKVYESYVDGLDRVPIPNERAIQNTLEITYRIAPKLAGLEIKKQLYFGAVERLRNEGFIEKLYR